MSDTINIDHATFKSERSVFQSPKVNTLRIRTHPFAYVGVVKA